MAESWQDTAFVLSTKVMNEHDALLDLLTQQHGRIRTIARYGATRKQRPLYQQGNVIACEWKARLREQMGHVQAEMVEAYAAYVLAHPLLLLASCSACHLCSLFVYERDAVPELFAAMANMYHAMRYQATVEALKHYALYEQQLLQSCGFGLDLLECAATSTTENLIYLSPKSGRAVSKEAGAPYHERLFRLPAFFLCSAKQASPAELLDALTINAYFIDKRLCYDMQRQLPDSRYRLQQKIQEHYG